MAVVVSDADTDPGTSTAVPETHDRAPQGDPLAAGQDRMLAGAEGFEKRYEDYTRKEQEAQSRLPQPPKLEKTGPPPQNDIRGDAMLWLGFATALGGIAGAMTKRSSMNALAAFSGTLDGLREGNQQKFNDEFKTWEAQAKATQVNNRAELDGYRNILERGDLDHVQRAEQLEIWATQNRNQFMLEIARHAKQTGDFTTFAAAIDSIRSHLDKGETAYERLVQAKTLRAQQQQDRLEQIRLQGENQIKAAQTRAEARQPLETDESLRSIAQRKYEGDPSAGRYLTGVNRSRFDEIFNDVLNEKDHSREEYIRNQQQYAGATAGARSTGTRVANLEQIQRSTLSLVQPALQASMAVPRAPVMAFAQAQQYLQAQIGDPALKTFVGYNIALAEQFARAQKPTGVLDVGLQARAFDFLTTAQSQRSYRAAVETIVRGIDRELRASKAQQAGEPITGINELLNAPPPKQGGLGAVGKGGGNPASSMSDDELRRQLGIQ